MKPLKKYVILILLLMTQEALASSPRVAVLPLRYEPPITASQAEQLRQSLTVASKRHNLEPIPIAEVDRLMAANDIECTSDRCLAQTATILGAELLVGGRAKLRQGSGQTVWTLALWMFDVQKSQTVAVLQNQCPACEKTQLNRWTERLIFELKKQAQNADAHSQIHVASKPPGATIAIDGSPIGVTPMAFEVAPGRHSLTATLAGYKLAVREVEVKADEIARIHLELEPDRQAIRDSNTPEKNGFFSASVFKWITLAGAFAGLTSGAVLVSIDGHQNCDRSRDFHQCAQERFSQTSGIVLLITGGISAIASGLLFWGQ